MAQLLSRIERLKTLLSELEESHTTPLERAKIRDRMRQEIEAARITIRRLSAHDPI